MRDYDKNTETVDYSPGDTDDAPADVRFDASLCACGHARLSHSEDGVDCWGGDGARLCACAGYAGGER